MRHIKKDNAPAVAWSDEGGKRLDQALRAREIKSVDVARALGVDHTLVSKWRRGQRQPKPDQLTAMLRLIGGAGLGDYVLGLTRLDPDALERVRRDVAALQKEADRDRGQ